MTHKKLLAQGGTVHYWINKKKKDADCIVFTHGLTADHTMFAKQAAYFSKKYTILGCAHAWTVQTIQKFLLS